ncbi:mycofactocin-coupled SDR family oxidoreductase [Nocardioides sp. P5_C9_2]
MSGRVEGKVALITGAARGQGRAEAVRLAQEGAAIIAVDICAPLPQVLYNAATDDDLAETVALVEGSGGKIVAAKADIRDRAALQAAIDLGVETFGKLDVVVANAGIMIMKPWDKVTPEDFAIIQDINVTGTWNTIQLAAPHLIAAGGGSMILTSSVAGLKGQPFLSPYTASKHAVVGLMRAYASELAQHKIRVNTVHPTGVLTGMGSGDAMTSIGDFFADNPRIAPMFMNMLDVDITMPEDQAEAVLWLASDESKFVTATELRVDAGCTAF